MTPINNSSTSTTYINPAIKSEAYGNTRQLALLQTISARQVLYQPGEMLKNELCEAAEKLHQIYGSLEKDDQKSLGARLFGQEGVMHGHVPNDLLHLLKRVSENPDFVSGSDRATVIAFMGDIGALYTDSNEASVSLRKKLGDIITAANLTPPTEDSIRNAKQEGGSATVGPDKRIERSKPPAELIDRTGIHNLGEEADDILGVSIGDRIPPLRWDVMHIDINRVANTVEPMVAHMSGSPAEILQTWDMLRGESPEQQFVTPHEQEQQLARAAGASAFLIGLGYHSAVEVLEGTLKYTGQSIRHNGVLHIGQRDAGHLFGQGAATDLMSEFFQAHTSQM
ncbi:hypothetical protein B0T41_21685 [Chromobacterium violaceum]|nr:hypothetical protein B0T41_21685 [Chromobacterium violaceum]